jgi:hypothetical protein
MEHSGAPRRLPHDELWRERYFLCMAEEEERLESVRHRLQKRYSKFEEAKKGRELQVIDYRRGRKLVTPGEPLRKLRIVSDAVPDRQGEVVDGESTDGRGHGTQAFSTGARGFHFTAGTKRSIRPCTGGIYLQARLERRPSRSLCTSSASTSSLLQPHHYKSPACDFIYLRDSNSTAASQTKTRSVFGRRIKSARNSHQ